MESPLSRATEERKQDTQATQPNGSVLAIFRDWVVIGIFAAVVGLDQLTKLLVDANMRLGQSIPAEGFFRLTYTTNSGTIFGLLPGATLVLTILSFGAIAFLLYFYRNYALTSPYLRLAIALLLGGAIGNLIDRLRQGTVIDFVDVGRWPIFNIADSAITVGIAIIVVFSFIMAKEEDRQKKQEESANPSSGN
ncbi:MAG: signal peptidase II [Chloroflexi bacterium]|nr:signal peptidase II [Chloroflexota bacterium]